MAKKLIEVALPLEAINVASAREKSIRHGHPSTLHLWWARRPLAAARAVIFSQMVDDPSEYLKDPKEIEQERQSLFRIIEDLVKWENTTNETVLEKARTEIRRSWERWCKTSGEDPAKLPPFHDPFAGGGALPLEAQRLGLEAHASDLNPVAVMINKAMIEIPPRFAGLPPVNPDSQKDKHLFKKTWQGAQGLAEDVRYYGKWMRDEAEKLIGHLYPKARITMEMAKDRPDLMPYVGRDLTVIAWLWARTVESSNPAFRGCHVPLVSSFWLSAKAGKETWVEPVVDGKSYRFEVRKGKPHDKAAVDAGTKLGRGANFRCVLSGTPLSPDYIKAEGIADRMGARLMAIVCEGDRARIYLPPTLEQERIAQEAKPEWRPEQELPNDPRNFWTVSYGLTKYADLFTPRQLVALTTFSDLIAKAQEQILKDFRTLEGTTGGTFNLWKKDDHTLREGGSGHLAYSHSISLYLGIFASRLTVYHCTQSRWRAGEGKTAPGFGRQALPMVWDYAEANPWAGAGGDFSDGVEAMRKTLLSFPASGKGCAEQRSALALTGGLRVFSSDPPYYDNIGYADLSDFFYVWMRRSFSELYPEMFGTMLVPKAEELVATPYRHGSREKAEAFFMDGMSKAVHAMATHAHPAYPVTIYYAFKQAEEDNKGVASTGWETFLDAILLAGFALTGTWPMRTENSTRLIGMGTNALASSIVMVCRPRPADAKIMTRKDFITELRRELPAALRTLQQGNIAPVDLAQASIGPGMAVYSRYSKIVENDGKPMMVRTALQLINQVLDETLAEQEGDFDPETAWSVAWFDQYGFGEGPFGDAETLSKAKNTALNALVDAGVVKTGSGKTRLLCIDELPGDWDPATDKHLTVWEMVHHLIRAMNEGGEPAAAALVAKLGGAADAARELAYRLYSICERRKRAPDALAYNTLVIAWPELMRLAAQERTTESVQQDLTFK